MFTTGITFRLGNHQCPSQQWASGGHERHSTHRSLCRLPRWSTKLRVLVGVLSVQHSQGEYCKWVRVQRLTGANEWEYKLECLLYSRKLPSGKNIVNYDRLEVRQEFIFVKCRSSLICSLVVRSLLFCLSYIFAFMDISDSTLVVLWKKFSQEVNLVKNLLWRKRWNSIPDENFLLYGSLLSRFSKLQKITFAQQKRSGVPACRGSGNPRPLDLSWCVMVKICAEGLVIRTCQDIRGKPWCVLTSRPTARILTMIDQDKSSGLGFPDPRHAWTPLSLCCVAQKR